jgi:hypothetical protein
MRVALKVLLGLLLLVVGAIAWWHVSFPTASYRYRLSVAVEADGQVHSGSSVIEVWYRFFPSWFAAGTFERHVEGQAVLINLGSRGALVAALGNKMDRTAVDASDLPIRAACQELLGSSAKVTSMSMIEQIHLTSRLRGRVSLHADNLPPFIWFPDNDPLNATAVKPDDFASVIGDSTRLLAAQIELTNDPIVIDIDKKLPAYQKLPPGKSSWDSLLANGVILHSSTFIGEGSAK